MYWMLLPLKRFSDFSGRSRRKEYWLFMLGFVILALVAGAIELALGIKPGSDIGDHPLILLLTLVLFIPHLAVQVRRYHDRDSSGWNVLWNFFPIAGVFIVLIAMCTDGTRGDNRYGPDPKDPGDIGDVFA